MTAVQHQILKPVVDPKRAIRSAAVTAEQLNKVALAPVQLLLSAIEYNSANKMGYKMLYRLIGVFRLMWQIFKKLSRT